jgi:cytochrome P450
VTPKDPVSFQLAMLWASAGNTVPSTFWTFYYILQTPAVLKRVLQEICESTGKASIEEVDGLISQEQLNKMVVRSFRIVPTYKTCIISI